MSDLYVGWNYNEHFEQEFSVYTHTSIGSNKIPDPVCSNFRCFKCQEIVYLYTN